MTMDTAKTVQETILVVDDEPALRDLLTDALQCEGLEIVTAASGRQAIEVCRKQRIDLVVTDIRLGDCTGLEVLDTLAREANDVPAVVVTGFKDAEALSEASQRRPLEIMTKPLDLDRLRRTVRKALSDAAQARRSHRRTQRLRHLARTINLERKSVVRQLDTTCAGLAAAYRSLSGRMAMQNVVIDYQRELLPARNDDDVFRALFRLFVQRSGAVFGIAMACDGNAELQICGRFGVPAPDNFEFCRALTPPVIEAVLANPAPAMIDAGERADQFEEGVRKFLPGVTLLAVPLIPAPGEMIGLIVLYRKGEQPFTDSDLVLAEMISTPTAVAVRRND